MLFFTSGKIKGKQLLDIGTGPVVYPIITASKWFDEIYLSDFSKENIELLQKWRRGDSDHMKPLMEYFAQKEEKYDFLCHSVYNILLNVRSILFDKYSRL